MAEHGITDDGFEAFMYDPELMATNVEESLNGPHAPVNPVAFDLSRTPNNGFQPSLDLAFAGHQQPYQAVPIDPEEPPADEYSPEIDWWYNRAPAKAPGAWFTRGVGWHFRVCKGDFSNPSAMTSGMNTPINAQPAYGQSLAAAASMYPVPGQALPQPYPITTPHLAIPQPPKRHSTGSTRAPTKPPHKKPNEASKKVSIKQTCVCGDARPQKGRIPRPQNKFLLYRSHHAARISDQNAQHVRDGRPDLVIPQTQMSGLLGRQWRAEPVDVKRLWQRKADDEKKDHEAAYPDYKYVPGSSKAHRFGDENCTCGAFQANTEHMAQKRAGKQARTDHRVNDNDGLAEFEPNFTAGASVATGSTPTCPAVQAQGSNQGQKRKRSAEQEQQQPIRRSPRTTRNNNAIYQEDDDEFDFDFSLPIQQQQHVPAHPTRGPSRLASNTTDRITTILSTQRHDSPAHNTRSRSHTPHTPPAGQIPSSPPVGLHLPGQSISITTTTQPKSPVHNIRSQSCSQVPKNAAEQAAGQNPNSVAHIMAWFDDDYTDSSLGMISDDPNADIDYEYDPALFGEDFEEQVDAPPQSRRSSSKKSSQASGKGSIVSRSGRRRSMRIAIQQGQKEEE